MTILTRDNAAIKYTDECGFYALLDGVILDDGSGISGTWEQACKRLAAIFDANREPMEDTPGWEFLTA